MKRIIAVMISVLLLASLFAGCINNSKTEEAGKPGVSQDNGEGSKPSAVGEKYYLFSSGISDAEIEQFAAEIKDELLTGDWEAIAGKANYPLRVGTAVYDTAEDFLAQNWDNYFSNEWKAALEAETCHEMGCNGEGFMLASGAVWVFDVSGEDGGEQLLIWSING